MPTSPEYRYHARHIPDMSQRFLRMGQGRISGYVSTFLGAMSVLTVLCFLFPSYLTTTELRSVYDPAQIRLVLRIAICVSLAFGGLTFALGRERRLGALGVLLAVLALALGAWHVEGRPTEARALALGLDWLLLDFLISMALFTFIEKLIPKYPDQAILRPEWRLDLVYFALNHLLLSVVLLEGNAFAPLAFGWATNARVQAAVTALPVAGQFVLLALTADLAQYWMHRAFHEVPWLWRFHAVHHSSESMDWLAGSRIHVLETLAERPLLMVPLYLLGPDRAALDAYVLFAALQAVLVHANVAIPFGPLRYLVTTPQYHHWHHSSERPALDTNFAVHVPLWDWLFGTLHMPGSHWPADYGTTERLPRGFLAQLVYPFQRIQ